MRAWRLAVGLLLVVSAATARADERIRDFHSDITVQPDASLLVHETILVTAEGRRIRHGIFRTFPTHYVNHNGGTYDVDFELLDSKRDGRPEQSEEDHQANGVVIKLGEASVILPRGEYTYELTYRVTRELGFFDDHDELFWDVTGFDWQFPIDRASATVTLPAAVQPSDIKLTGYTGPHKSREQNLTFRVVDPTTVTFETTQPLGSGEALRIVVGFPRGLVAEPSAADRRRAFLAAYVVPITGGIGLLVVILCYGIAWLFVGRDPKPGVIVVSYEPPPELSPAAIRFLQRMGYDDRVLVSAVVDLAVKGHLTIQQEASTYRLNQQRGKFGALPPEERNLLANLFAGRTELTVARSESFTLNMAKTMLIKDLNVQENRNFFLKNRLWALPGILLTVGTLVAMAQNFQGPTAGAIPVLMIFVTVWSAVCYALLGAAASARKSKAKGATATTIMSVAFAASDLVLIAIFVSMAGAWAAAILLALLVANAIGIRALRALTPAGRRLMDQIEGFKQYLMEVDSDRIRRLNPPEKTPALFEKLLPYALALGVEQAWASQFAGVLAQAATVAAATTSYSPDWYSSTAWDTFDAARFTDNVSTDFSAAISSASTAPGSSSGFSDGGSSDGGGGGGDGGGGGGGGGW